VGTLNAIVQTCDLAYNLKPITKTDLDSTTSFVLYGSEQLSDDNNLIIFIAVQKYIFDSRAILIKMISSNYMWIVFNATMTS
jgi:hypothetical protein